MKYSAFKLDITEKHLAEGKPRKSEECPIALAAREFFAPLVALGMVSNVWVGYSGLLRVQLGVRNHPHEILNFRAPWASRIVERFDRNQHVAAQTLYFSLVP